MVVVLFFVDIFDLQIFVRAHIEPLRFEATYKAMITEWIDVNVNHI
jgi:hypothetical protein